MQGFHKKRNFIIQVVTSNVIQNDQEVTKAPLLIPSIIKEEECQFAPNSEPRPYVQAGYNISKNGEVASKANSNVVRNSNGIQQSSILQSTATPFIVVTPSNRKKT